MLQQNIKPRYEVEKVDEMVTETRLVREDGRNVEKKVEVPFGFMVYFPAGHSIRVKTEEELKRLGYDGPAELIDEETGDVVGSTAQTSLKRAVQRRTSASKRRPAATSSVDASRGD